MATKKVTKEVVEPTIGAAAVKVLGRYRVEKVGNDAHVFERIKLDDSFAGEKGVQEFIGTNGNVTYYIEKLVKKYSDNVVKT